MEVSQCSAIAFSIRACHAVIDYVYSHAQLVWNARGVGCEKMPMTGADLADHGGRIPHNGSDFPTQRGAAIRDHLSIRVSPQYIRAELGSGIHSARCPLPASIVIIRIEMSAGLTPLIRLA